MEDAGTVRKNLPHGMLGFIVILVIRSSFFSIQYDPRVGMPNQVFKHESSLGKEAAEIVVIGIGIHGFTTMSQADRQYGLYVHLRHVREILVGHGIWSLRTAG